MKNWKRIKKWLERQKEGIIMGAVVGILLQTQYVYNWMGQMQILKDPLWYGFAVTLSIAILTGALIDSVYKPKR